MQWNKFWKVINHLKIRPASQLADGMSMIAAALITLGRAPELGPRAPTLEWDSKTQTALQRLTGVASAVQATASLCIPGSQSNRPGDYVEKFACRWSKGAKRSMTIARKVARRCVFGLFTDLGGGRDGVIS